MASALAKIVAGTFVEDAPAPTHATLHYMQRECREGGLKQFIHEFAQAQPEFVDAELVRVESYTENTLCCVLPFKHYDHESGGAFQSQIRFTLNPVTGQAVRLLD